MPATPFLFSLRQDRCEPEDDFRCGGERWNRRPNDVTAGTGRHSGGFLLRIMPPSWQPVPACVRHGHSAGGPLFRAAAMVLQAEPFFFAATTIVLQAEPIFFAATTIVLHRFQSLALKSRIDARKRA